MDQIQTVKFDMNGWDFLKIIKNSVKERGNELQYKFSVQIFKYHELHTLLLYKTQQVIAERTQQTRLLGIGEDLSRANFWSFEDLFPQPHNKKDFLPLESNLTFTEAVGDPS